jgi:hypothetical protein
MNLLDLWNQALNCVRNGGKNDEYLSWYRSIPEPGEVDEQYFFSELAWAIYNTGAKECVIRKKWPALKHLLMHFDPDLVVENEKIILDAVLCLIKNTEKARAVISSARKIIADRPISEKLAAMNESQALKYLEGYPYLSKAARTRVAMNLGFQIYRPDHNLLRLSKAIGYSNPDILTAAIAGQTGERKKFIEYVLWQWIVFIGWPNAYELVRALSVMFGGEG